MIETEPIQLADPTTLHSALVSGGTRADPHVEIIDSDERFHALGPAWSALCDASHQQSVFGSWEWMSCWWHHYRHRWKLRVFTVMDGGGRLLGVVPLVRRLRFVGPIPIRCLSLMASEGAYASHLDVIAREEDRDAVTRLFVDYVHAHSRRWDVIDFRGLAKGSALDSNLGAAPGRHWHSNERGCPYVDLPNDWEEYRRSLKKKVRRNLNYFENLLRRECRSELRCRLAKTEAEVVQALDRLQEMHRRRIPDSALHDHTFAEFHKEFALSALEAGWLRLYSLEVGDTTIAVLYCLSYKGCVSAYLSGFDPVWARYSPGRQIAALAIRDAIEEGANLFDWMQGEDRYKYEWTDLQRVDRRRVNVVSSRGLVWLWAVRARHRLVQLARTRLSRQSRRLIRAGLSLRVLRFR